MDALSKIKEKIARDEIVLGSHITLNESCIAEIMGDVGFDFVWIDCEHSPIDYKETLQHIMAARSSGTAAFVRVPWNDPVLAKPILEMGVQGVIFPFVNTAEQAEQAVKSCLYPPKGIRGYNPRRAENYGLMDKMEYIEKSGDMVWKIIQIEHIEAVRNLDEILKVEGIDAIVVGPSDLSGSIGLMGQTAHPEVKKLLDEISEKVVKAGIPLGVSTGFEPPEVINDWLRRGVNWIGVGVDVGYMVRGSQSILKNTRELIAQGGRK